jgi:hypothetical protein
VADLVHKSVTSGPDPQLAEHFATKGYTDASRNDWQIFTFTSNVTLGLGSRGSVVHMNSASATTVTVPANATVAYPVGTVIRIRKLGTGNVTVAGAGGVTINWVGGNFTITAQYGMAEIHKTVTDTWYGMLLP